MVADAAADEQLAHKMLKGRRLGGAVIDEQIFPNCLITLFDKCHAARRIATRGFNLPGTAEIMDIFIGPESFVQVIQHSWAVQEVFSNFIHQHQQSVVKSKTIKDLKAAKHRFESTQKPLSRACLFVRPLILTALQVRYGRHGQVEARKASRFLDSLSVSNLLLLGCMADAGDELDMLIRFCDNESYDSAVLAEKVWEFVHRCLGAILGNHHPPPPNHHNP